MKGFVSEISDKEASNEESLEFYNSTFEGYEQRLALIATRVYTKLEKRIKKRKSTLLHKSSKFWLQPHLFRSANRKQY